MYCGEKRSLIESLNANNKVSGEKALQFKSKHDYQRISRLWPMIDVQ